MTQPPLIAIVGSTAIGKTAFALEMAQRIGGEIVSADSRQVYRYMDIGTAKPTPAQCEMVPHHLVDFIDPNTPFSLAIYQDQAMAKIADITARNRVPLLVGGTGQYLAAVLQGWTIPRVPPQPALRAELEQEAATYGNETLHARLAEVDPQAARSLTPENLRRIIRALEVYQVTGKPISMQQQHKSPPYDITTFWLRMPAEQNYERIDNRVDVMMERGLIDEVSELLERGYHWDLPSLSSLGYIQFRPYFEQQADLRDCVQRLKYDTHRFARQQKNWFRRLPALTMIDA